MINQGIPFRTIFPFMRLVIEFYHTDYRKIRCSADNKVHMLLVHFVPHTNSLTVG
ncbi:hypothetical protein GEOBRER4_n3648 [Citrifermentans bremense]|uniref:Uncharacterized protein n=1 Tax=Citrifermentans bremense TaxID=60035 RepID=A0A6S6M4Y5_9BACT|nr:hypothetical protein GEOBRER4_n3648 [Citrifermentans bremense]